MQVVVDYGSRFLGGLGVTDRPHAKLSAVDSQCQGESVQACADKLFSVRLDDDERRSDARRTVGCEWSPSGDAGQLEEASPKAWSLLTALSASSIQYMLSKGGEIDLTGAEVDVAPPARGGPALVVSRPVHLVGGVLRFSGVSCAIQVLPGGELEMTGVVLVGAGVLVASDEPAGPAAALLTDVRVVDAAGSGLAAHGRGSSLSATGVAVTGAEGHGVSATAGAEVELLGSEVVGSGGCGVAVSGAGSSVELEGCVIRESRSAHGTFCCDGGCLEMRDTDVLLSGRCGAAVMGTSSRLAMLRGCVKGAAGGFGLHCTDGAQLEAQSEEVAGCLQSGVAVSGPGSVAVLHGMLVHDCAELDGMSCDGGARIVARHCTVADCGRCALAVMGYGSRASLDGGSLSGSQRSHGAACADGGLLELHGVEIRNCAGSALAAVGEGTVARAEGGSAAGCGSDAVFAASGGAASWTP